jgi:hypothetical protein
MAGEERLERGLGPCSPLNQVAQLDRKGGEKDEEDYDSAFDECLLGRLCFP